MNITVQQNGDRPETADSNDTWVLVPDNWNDFGYLTLYELFYVDQGELVALGGIKIMRKAQQPGMRTLPVGSVGHQLPDDCCSLGSSLDFYASIVRKFGRTKAQEVLESFRDAATDAQRRNTFFGLTAFRKSLHRDRADATRFYEDVAAIFEAGGGPPDRSFFEFGYVAHPEADPISFRFGQVRQPPRMMFRRLPPFSGPTPKEISRRSVVLVGANGVGKTTLLAKLARLAYTPAGERKASSEDGALTRSPAFPSIVAVAYSAFDTFLPPTLEGDDVDALADQMDKGNGRYVYCGMRDLAHRIRNPDAPHKLKTIDDLAYVFADKLQRLRDLSRIKLFSDAMVPVLDEIELRKGLSSQQGETPPSSVDRLEAFLGSDPVAVFQTLSSGHKIVLHLLASLTASLRLRGLALIDEPETHLHPPLLAALMAGLRTVLDGLESYAIIASHSPIVAQETLASQIIVMEGNGVTRGPSIQTFGENIGALTREIFGLHTDATGYRTILDRMARHYKTIEAVEDAMREPLSGQAVAHLMAALPESE